MSQILGVVSTLLLIYSLVMWGRFVADLVRQANRDWKPAGALLVAVSVVYALTDPYINVFRRLVPSIRIGPVLLDLSWGIGLIVVLVLMAAISMLSGAIA